MFTKDSRTNEDLQIDGNHGIFLTPHLADVPELQLAPRRVKRFFTKQLTLGCIFKSRKEISSSLFKSNLIDDTDIVNAPRSSENGTFEVDDAKGR